jgi:lycopene beta-cyclase
MTRQLAILGGGCAGLTLAAKANAMPDLRMMVIEHPDYAKAQDHNWGCWAVDGMQDAHQMARKTWHRWAINTDKKTIVQTAQHFPYMAISSAAWKGHCRITAKRQGVEFQSARLSQIDQDQTGFRLIADQHLPHCHQIADSRTPDLPDGIMLQHFRGIEVLAENPVFDPDCAVLMDFRCDQSRGIHFIYILPYSSHQALVESTMFSPRTEDDAFYDHAITRYCDDVIKTGKRQVLRREAGVIPMGFLTPRDDRFDAIGGNGGAIRPSSGYAFTFIQRQIHNAVLQYQRTGVLRFPSPHQRIDLWMDKVFLTVLRHRPDLAPTLFSHVASALRGDEMALFMSGLANHSIRLKIIMAMPKWPFLRALLSGSGQRVR